MADRRQRGTRRSGTVRVGCSGWMYDDWRHTVYTGLPKRSWFGRYTELFDTVELNATFYRLPELATVGRWADDAPTGFLYAAKLGQFGSHRMKLRDPLGWLGNHVDRIDALGAHAGPTLVQLPPNWKVNAGRLDEFLDAWPDRLRVAVELRHSTWLVDDVFSVLERHGAALCLHDLLPDHPLVRTTDWTYLRFHGTDPIVRPYHGRYGARRLRPLADLLGGWVDDGCDVYAYFNNDWDANAVADATWFRQQLARPPGLDDGSSNNSNITMTSSDAPLVPKAAPWPDDHRLTDFQRKVVDTIAALAPGDLATYGEIAEEAGFPGSAQAVGNVVRAAPDLPWWRIVPADGRLYCSHLRTQQPLLEAEGHRVDRNRRVHAAAERR